MNPADPEPAPSNDPDLTRTTTGASSPSLAFGPYRLLKRLGEGGMGEVWLAEQLQPLRRQVALKVIKAGMDTAQVVARFEAERQALAVMDHPAIARVFDAGATPEGRPYFAMEYVRGEPMTTYCDRHRLTTDERIELFLQVCDGVQHAHQKAIIHRDLKPSNVLVTLQDDRPVPKIIDFGLAKATTPHLTERSLFTEVGALIGTPEYMSPEQAEMGGLDIDTRTDVYALGVILYELLTGGLPFDGKALRQQGLDEIRRTIRDDEAPRPSTRISQTGSDSVELAKSRRTEPARLVSRLRGDLDWITMRALEKDRTRRYQTANALAADIRRSLNHEPVTAGPPSTTYRMGKFVRRHRTGVAVAGVLIALLVAFGTTMAVQAQRIAQERDRANREADRASKEAAAATQVSNFLVGLFKVSDPSEARGNSVTAREILDTGAREIGQTLSEQPELQARLQATIGAVYTSLGVFDAAVPLLQQAVATRRRLLGDDNPDTLSAVNELANAYWFQGRFQEAEPLYLDVVDQRTRALGDDHPDTLRANFDLASLYLRQQRLDAAEVLIRSTWAAQARVLGEDHPDTLASLNNLQGLLFNLERYGEAEPIAARVLETRRRVLGDDHPQTATAAHNLASNYARLGVTDQAELLFLEAIATRRRIQGEMHHATARTRSRLADMYLMNHRYDDAEPLLLSACEGFMTSFGVEHPETRGAIEQLAHLYEAWGKRAKAAEWRAKLTTKKAAPSR